MDITGHMYLFGINIPIMELLLLLSIVIVVYLIILEFEFRQIRNIVKKFDDEELILTKSIRELRDSINDLRGITGLREKQKEKTENI